MKHEYSLAQLTVLALPPIRMIDAAARAGYDYVSLRLTRVTPTETLYPLITDRALMKETKARLAATGLSVWDVELARLAPENDPESYVPLLEAAAELSARHVITQLPDPDRRRAVDRFATICDLARPLGLGCDLEFMVWQATPDLTEAARVLKAVDKPNAGLLVDTMHFDRSNSSIEELKRLPREWFRFAHVCDAPREKPTNLEGLLYQARCERMFPGDGGIDIRGILACMPPDIPYSLEIPGDTLAGQIGLEEYACRALRAAKNFLDVPSETSMAGAAARAGSEGA
jgi:sugar phosphate isomerase/epimerase